MIKVEDVMTPIVPKSLISVKEDDKVRDVLKKFAESGKTRLIVQRGDMPDKILRITDITKVKPNMTIKKIIPNLESVNRVVIGDDIQKLISAKASQPVTIVFDTSNKPTGIITPSDVLRYLKSQTAKYNI